MRFHVVGIGGAGMSAVARLLMAHGEVSGSDQGRWPLSEPLRALGATVHDRFDAKHVEGADIVVRSSAYTEENVEVAAALARGTTVWKRHDAWRFLAEGKRVIAVAGTHGKTTTTAMTWTALRGAGVDASLICGAALVETGTNAHVGASDVLVIEADEYDRVFHALEPAVAVVTNVDHDHVDQFPTREDYADAFRTFALRLQPSGALIACADDPGSAALAAWARANLRDRHVVTYGSSEGTYTIETGTKGVRLSGPGGATVDLALKVPGAHNALNAGAAVAAVAAIGVPVTDAARALASFSGTGRRLESLGSAGGIAVVDDYAHHPVEILASIEAVRERGKRVVVVFQPHTAGRLDHFFDGFVAALRGTDAAVVAETFASARNDADTRGRARALAEASGARYARDPEEAARQLAELARPGDTVLVLGAGDIRIAGERLLELLREREGIAGNASRIRRGPLT